MCSIHVDFFFKKKYIKNVLYSILKVRNIHIHLHLTNIVFGNEYKYNNSTNTLLKIDIDRRYIVIL